LEKVTEKYLQILVELLSVSISAGPAAKDYLTKYILKEKYLALLVSLDRIARLY